MDCRGGADLAGSAITASCVERYGHKRRAAQLSCLLLTLLVVSVVLPRKSR